MKNDIDKNIICHCDKITKIFKGQVVLRDVTLSIGKGEIIGVIGRNGCGKTTLLSIIAGLIAATAGKMVFQGDRPLLGALIHSPAFFPHLNAYDNLRYIARIKKLNNRHERIEEAINKVGLVKSDKLYKHFSLGMSQRLAIAAALLGDPDLVILDEPTNGIDPVDIEEVKSLIKATVRADSTIIITSHSIHDIIDVCDHLIIMREGEIILDERMESLQQKAAVNGVYLKESLIKLL